MDDQVRTLGTIHGEVTFGPLGPVVRRGGVNYRPYQARISVLDETGRLITQCDTDQAGRFVVNLDAGEYTLRPESPGPHPRAAQQVIRVRAGQVTRVGINYDSGIR
jgi:hypothetical protein